MCDSILTVVDAESFDKNHFDSEAALKQITYGDIILLNKVDLVSEEKLVELENFIRDKKDTAKILRTNYGKVALPLILGVELTPNDKHVFAKDDHHDHHHHEHHHHDHDHHHSHHLENDRFVSVSFQVDKPFDVGSPHSNHEYLLPELDAFVALERVLSSGADVLFCGHTHVPYVRKLDATNLHFSLVNDKKQENRSFTAALKQIINAGSVGEPRHGRPNATYVIYDTDTQQVTLREVSYNYQKTCTAIIELGLPTIFAWRLARGLEFAERADDPTHICTR